MSYWIELDIPADKVFSLHDEIISNCSGVTSHHFFWEPWSDGVIRVERATDDWQDIESIAKGICGDTLHIVPWDHTPEQTAYGKFWQQAKLFWHTSSRLAILFHKLGEGTAPQLTRTKFVHCFLNAQGMDRPQEFGFHADGQLSSIVGWVIEHMAPNRIDELIESFRKDKSRWQQSVR